MAQAADSVETVATLESVSTSQVFSFGIACDYFGRLLYFLKDYWVIHCVILTFCTLPDIVLFVSVRTNSLCARPGRSNQSQALL